MSEVIKNTIDTIKKNAKSAVSTKDLFIAKMDEICEVLIAKGDAEKVAKEKAPVIQEIQGDLFDAPEDAMIAHCIPANYSFGPGIARKIEELYDMRYELFMLNDIPVGESYNKDVLGKAIRVNRVYNLINKPLPRHKPYYETMRSCLEDMRNDMLVNNFKKVYMPKIGCGRDKLDWNEVKAIIEDVFKDTDIEVTVCSL